MGERSGRLPAIRGRDIPDVARLVARLLAAGSAVGLGFLTLGSSPVHAEAGSCTATLNGRDAATGTISAPINVEATATVVATGTAASGPVSYSVRLGFFAETTWEVASGTASGSSWRDEIDIAEYATKGVGLYRVEVTATDGDGQECSTTTYVNVEGSLMSSAAGKVAVAATALGGAAVIGATGLALRAPRSKGPNTTKGGGPA